MDEILLSVSNKRFSCALSESFLFEALLNPYYWVHSFSLEPESDSQENPTQIYLHCSETETENWKCGSVVYRSRHLQLLKTDTEYFIVETAFLPPRLFWVARSDFSFKTIEVWCNDCATPSRQLPIEVYVESALREIIRLVLMYDMLRDQSGLLFHTAALDLGGRIWLFSGCSGAGKSTFSRLWLDRADAHVVNDDRMIVRQNESGPGFTAYGTPWPGELGIALNESAPLGGICFLHQSAQTEIRPITPQQALPQLLPLASIPWYEQDLVPPALDFCDRLLAGVPLYELHFRPDQSAVEAVLQLAG